MSYLVSVAAFVCGDRVAVGCRAVRLLIVGILVVHVVGLRAVVADEGASWREIEADVVYGHKSGLALTYDVIRPTRNANGAAAVFMMSGGWVSVYVDPHEFIRPAPEKKNLHERIVDHGYTLFVVRHSSSPRFQVPDAVADVREAVGHIRAHAADYGIDPERIGVYGGSAGGHLALMLGTTRLDEPLEALPAGEAASLDSDASEGESAGRAVKCVVAFFPPTDLNAYVGPERIIRDPVPALEFPAEQLTPHSPLFHVSADDVPTLLVHGDEDPLVPLEQSRLIQRRFEEANVAHRLLVIEGAGHSFQGEAEERALAGLLEWMDRYLGVGGGESQ